MHRVPGVVKGARTALAILIGGTLCLAVTAATGQSYEEQIAQAKADMERAKHDLRVLQARQQALMRDLDANSQKHVGEAILDMYQTGRKFNLLRDARDRGELTEAEAIAELEKFTGVRSSEPSLEGAFVDAMNEVKKGRLAAYDKLDERKDVVLDRYAHALQRLRILESGGTPDDPEKYTRPEARPLAITVSPPVVNVEVDEVGVVTVTVNGSKPPLTLRVTSLSGEQTRQMKLESRQPVALPFSFTTPGVRTVDISVEDDGFPRQLARATVTFRVTGEEPEGEQDEEKPTDTPDTAPQTQKPQEPPKPPQPPKKPGDKPQDNEEEDQRVFPMPVGTFNARLWRVFDATASGWADYFQSYTVFTLSIDPAGNMTGQANYVLPQGWLQKSSQDVGWEKLSVQFRLQGSTNPNSGETIIQITDGFWELAGHERPDNYEKWARTKFDLTLRGWRLPHTGIGRRAKERLYEFGVYLGWIDLIQNRAQSNQSGQLTAWMGDVMRGKYPSVKGVWFGGYSDSIPALQEMAKSLSPAGQKVVADHIDENRKWGLDACTWVVKSSQGYVHCPNPKVRLSDNTADVQKNKDTMVGEEWLIELLGPAQVAPPPPVAAAKPEGELVGFGIWPESPLRVTAGQAFQLEAVGVYAENVFNVKQLHDNRSQWAGSRGLEKLGGPGQYRAPEPGKYQVRVRRQRNDGSWMSDTITIVVRSAAATP